jgi:DNA-binding transcriptional LysR family regulator
MELRHLRYFFAVAEERSLTLAAERRLHTSQPSLSRQIRDLEYEVGAQLMTRSARGIELTEAGRVFLDHARLALAQVEAAREAARRAAQPAKQSFRLGFLTGQEMDWLPEALRILRDELPNIEVTVLSQYSPDLADALMRGNLDLAFFRREAQAPDLVFKLVTRAARRRVAERSPPCFTQSHRATGNCGRDIHKRIEHRPHPSGCHRRLLEAIRDRYQAGSRSGQSRDGHVLGGVDARRRAPTRLCPEFPSVVCHKPSDKRRCANDRSCHWVSQGQHICDPQAFSFKSGRLDRQSVARKSVSSPMKEEHKTFETC